jgi:acyl-CoA synthetase (AMP-forming)/AMP-acid ligase II
VRAVWPGLATSTVAAFAVEHGHEEPLLVIALELGRGRLEAPLAAELASCIRIAVAAEHGLSVAATVVVPAGALPRTSSGKLRRGACRDQFTAGHWDAARLEAWEAAPHASITSHPRERIPHEETSA